MREIFDPVINETYTIPDPTPLEIVPHPSAPLFSRGEEGLLTLQHLATQLQSPGLVLTNEIIELVQQASKVSLYFFLKYIAGAYGPYSDITDHIHADVCNFRQRQLQAGSRAAVFLPRSFFKSTICTHGAITWELLRDPNLRVGLVAANKEMAEQFMLPTKVTFEENPLFSALFPDYCPRKSESGKVIDGDWSSTKITLPNRTINADVPSIKCLGAGGAAAGNHFDLLSVDDLVSDKELDASRSATSEMLKKGQWFSSNQDTLLVSPRTSRVFLAATRYAIDDPYEDIFQEIKTQYGYWDELPYEINEETGIWDVYYRMAIEQDEYIFPEKMGKRELDRIKLKDQWKYYTQYLNNPHSAAVSEFIDYTVKDCELDFTNNNGYIIHTRYKKVYLHDCIVTLGLDPAASEKRLSARTSRSAIVVQAKDVEGNRYYIDGSVGYYTPTKLYDELFRLYTKFRGYVSSSNIEAHGGFKIVWNSIIEEEQKRQVWIGRKRINPLPDKDAKLRDFIQPLLHGGKIWAAKPIDQYLRDEIRVFPGGHLKDTLDACEIADRGTPYPEGAYIEREEDEEQYLEDRRQIRSRAGY